jgi:hypothetical protein
MLSETVVTALLEASITGAGLVLAVYALITPISEGIFRKREERLESLLKEFDEEKVKIEPDASPKDFKHLKELAGRIQEIRIFPRYLGAGVVVTFFSFMVSTLIDWGWLVQPANRLPENDIYIALPFLIAIFLFLSIGVLTIGEIYDMMRKEFEDIKKRQKEAKEASVGLPSSLTIRAEAKAEKKKDEHVR